MNVGLSFLYSFLSIKSWMDFVAYLMAWNRGTRQSDSLIIPVPIHSLFKLCCESVRVAVSVFGLSAISFFLKSAWLSGMRIDSEMFFNLFLV